VSEQKTKPAFDEATLGKLLEAAHVLQQHSRDRAHVPVAGEEHIDPLAPEQEEPRAPWEEPEPAPQAPVAVADGKSTTGSDFTLTLAHIVEAQHQIQTRRLPLDEAAALVVKRAAGMTNASGAAICLLEDDKVRTLAGCGRPALQAGTELSLQKSLSKACLRTRQLIHCGDINQEFLVDVDECRRRGILALIIAPIFRDGEIAGSLEIYFADAQTFTDQDVHACQLTAGLITEVLDRDRKQADAIGSAPDVLDPCPRCGHNFQPLELFCGKCGSARATPPPKTGTEDHLPALGIDENPPLADTDAEKVAIPSVDDNLAPLLDDDADRKPGEAIAGSQAEEPASTALATTADNWASAANARDFLESLALARSSSGFAAFWKSHRGDLSLAAAVVLVAIAIRWGIWSSPVGANTKPPAPGHRRRIDPEAGLSVTDKLMISLGLADPPDPVEDKGNPSTQVWVDSKSGLYYCPGSDSYGKTAKGKYELQRDAQLDEYEPADRRACD